MLWHNDGSLPKPHIRYVFLVESLVKCFKVNSMFTRKIIDGGIAIFASCKMPKLLLGVGFFRWG